MRKLFLVVFVSIYLLTIAAISSKPAKQGFLEGPELKGEDGEDYDQGYGQLCYLRDDCLDCCAESMGQCLFFSQKDCELSQTQCNANCPTPIAEKIQNTLEKLNPIVTCDSDEEDKENDGGDQQRGGQQGGDIETSDEERG